MRKQKSRRITSSDELFRTATTQWKRLEGGLPSVQLEFGPAALVRPGGSKASIHGTATSGIVAPPVLEPQCVVTTVQLVPFARRADQVGLVTA